MALEIQSKNVTLNGTTAFTFSNPVTQYLAGIASFQLSYGDDDHHVQEMSIQLQPSQPSSEQVTVQTVAILQDDSGHSIDVGASYVTVTVLAWTGTATTQVELTGPYAIANDGQSPGITLPSLTDPILQSVISGFYLSYGSEDHHVARVQASVGDTQNGNIGYISATADMNDASGNHALDPTASGDLVATSLSGPGFVVASYTGQSQTQETAIEMGATISSAVSFLTGFQAQYPDSDDHHVKAIGAGPDQTQVDPNDSTKAQTNGVWAWMYDDSGNNQDNSNSHASIVVVGVVEQSC